MLIKKKLESAFKTGFFHLFGTLLLVQVLAFGLKISLGHWLNTEDFARASLLIETNNLLATLMALGLPTAMIRYGLSENRLDDYLSGTLRLFSLLALVVSIGFLGINALVPLFTDPLTQTWVVYSLWAAPGLALFSYLINWLSAKKQAKERALVVLGQRALYALCLGIGAFLGALKGVVLGLLCQGLILPFLLLGRYRKAALGPHVPIKKRALLRFSGIDSLSHLAGFIAPFWILWASERGLAHLEEVSWLAMAFSFSVVAKFFFASLYNVAFPYLMEKREKRAFSRFLWLLIGLGLVMGLLVMGFGFTLLPWLIGWLLPAKFLASVPLLGWLLLAECLIGLSLIYEMALESLAAVRIKAGALLSGLLVMSLVLYPAMENAGALGLAQAFLIFAVVRLTLAGLGTHGLLALKQEDNLR